MATIAVFAVLGGGAYAQSIGGPESVKRFMIEDRANGAKKTRLKSLGAGHLRDALTNRIRNTTPGGEAGGDLGGEYPDPIIADGAVTAPKLGNLRTEVESQAVANGAGGNVVAACEADERRISGGYRALISPGNDITGWTVFGNLPTDDGWRVFGRNESGGPGTLQAFAICLGG